TIASAASMPSQASSPPWLVRLTLLEIAAVPITAPLLTLVCRYRWACPWTLAVTSSSRKPIYSTAVFFVWTRPRESLPILPAMVIVDSMVIAARPLAQELPQMRWSGRPTAPATFSSRTLAATASALLNLAHHEPTKPPTRRSFKFDTARQIDLGIRVGFNIHPCPFAHFFILGVVCDSERAGEYPYVCGRPRTRQKWRRGWDSNPRYGFPYARFRGEYFQPLSHLSAVVAGFIVAERCVVRQSEGGPFASACAEQT